jgi:chemotaxis protein MotB
VARKRKPEHANHERWLVSYADFITLLFAFFVVLYASSAADKNKMSALAEAIENAFQTMGAMPGSTLGPPLDRSSGTAGSTDKSKHVASRPEELARLVAPPKKLSSAEQGAPVDLLKVELEKLLQPEIQRRSVALRIGPEGLVISLRELGFFPSGSATVRSEAKPTIERIAELLRSKDCMLRVEGHTDNVPIHTDRFNSNWELSTTRATEIVKLLIDDYRFPSENLSAAGFGEYHPIAGNDSAAGRSLNRRVDIIILSQRRTQQLDKAAIVSSR